MEIRPRSTGEVLDDAWRLALADAPALLLFSALFLIPAFTILLLLLGQPMPTGITQCLLPALAALLLPLTGLASGACQELFRRRAAGEDATAGACLAGALRHGLEHAAARGVLLCGTLPGVLLFLAGLQSSASPGLKLVGFLLGPLLLLLLAWPLAVAAVPLHALIGSGAARSGTLLHELRRDAAFAASKAAAVVLCRLPLLLLVALELHLLGAALLWIADNLGGFDTALLGVELSFLVNPIYTTALFLLSGLLLTPFFEAGNFLLHTDIRTRQEGLDLQYRVQRAFGVAIRPPVDTAPRKDRGRPIGAVLLLLALGLTGRSVWADEGQRDTVRFVRQGVEAVRDEVKKSEPYPGGERWLGRLRNLGARLTTAAGGDPRRFRWYHHALTDFGERKKEDALLVLDDLHRRLALLEESLTPPRRTAEAGDTGKSPEDIKSLLRRTEGRTRERAPRQERIEEPKQEPEQKQLRREKAPGEAPGAGGGGGPRVSAPSGGGGGFSLLGWLLLGGLALAVVVVALVLYLNAPRRPRAAKAPAEMGVDSTADTEARQVLEESPDALWRQAEALADAGRFREAVRVLYLAVLALLHRRQLIRFEPTRTNGEYVRQVRLSEQAPPELHEPFFQLTRLFEAKWYGERSCESADQRACLALAEEVQRLAARGPHRQPT